MPSSTVPVMGTLATVQVVGDGVSLQDAAERSRAIEHALAWFHRIEQCCTRFDPASEVMQLAAHAGVAVPVSAMLFEAVRLALAVAEASGGAFDPTVGRRMELRGFDREHRTGAVIRTQIAADEPVSYRDVSLDPGRKTITLRRPLILDLGAVAKGLAIDMAARELIAYSGFAIDAGGDLYLGGRNPEGDPWRVGIRHPREDHELIDAVHVTNRAVCTSGDYERRSPGAGGGHHIIDPRSGDSPASVASVTVIAQTAVLADALATAAFVLGPVDGIRLLERHGVEGLIVTPTLERHATQGMDSEVNRLTTCRTDS